MFFQVKQPDFENIEYFSSYVRKIIKKRMKQTLGETLLIQNQYRLLIQNWMQQFLNW